MSDHPPSADLELFHRADLDQRGVRAARVFTAGERIMTFGAVRWHATPNRMTLQVSAHRHFELDPPLLESINHGCDPNVHFDVDRNELSALRDIAAGEELTAFYPSSEWDMQSPFACSCGSPRCHHTIRGARHLPAAAMAHYRTSTFVTAQLAEVAAQAAGQPTSSAAFDGLPSLRAFAPELLADNEPMQAQAS